MRHSIFSRRPLPGGEPTAGGYRLSWQGTAVMGILNVTPDSFSDGGRHQEPAAAVAAAQAMFRAGALIVDVGGESTRPGAAPVPPELELERIVPVIRALAGKSGGEPVGVISVDTRHAEVARVALREGAHLINDVGGLRDPAMLAVVAEAGAPAVVMHMQGEPQTMQLAPSYRDVVAEVAAFLRERTNAALEAGVPSVMIDPGLGFGKTLTHNVALLRRLEVFVGLGAPLLVGASRKRMIGTLAGVDDPAERDPGSLAAHLHAARKGAAMVRAHAVAAHVQALAVWQALTGDGTHVGEVQAAGEPNGG